MTTADTRPTAFAAPARARTEDDDAPALSDQDRDLHMVCERWVRWCITRRLYGPKPITGTILGRLSGCSMRPMEDGGADAISSAELSAFHIAYTCQPDALDKNVFDAYYVHRIKPIKAAAAALQISRPHFYAVLQDFRRRVAHAAAAIVDSNAQELHAMEQRRAARNAHGTQIAEIARKV